MMLLERCSIISLNSCLLRIANRDVVWLSSGYAETVRSNSRNPYSLRRAAHSYPAALGKTDGLGMSIDTAQKIFRPSPAFARKNFSVVVEMTVRELNGISYLELKPVYRAVSKEAAETALDELETKWGQHYPVVLQSWRRKWENLSAYFHYPSDIRSHLHHECD